MVLAKCKCIAFWAVLVLACGAYAQETLPDEVPFEEGKEPPAGIRPGEGWCLVTKPACYKTVSKQVEVQPATHYLEAVPAKWETREEQVQICPEKKSLSVTPCKFRTETVQVLIRPEYKCLEVVPAVFEDAEETVEVKPAYDELCPVPACYKTVSETIEVCPASTYWKKERDNCVCLCERPAKFITVCKEVLDKDCATTSKNIPCQTRCVKVKRLVKPAQVVERVVPAEYCTVEKQVLDQPCKTDAAMTPAKFQTICKDVCVTPSTTQKVEIPAKFETVCETVLESPARLVWKKIKCDCGEIVKRYREVPGTDEASLLNLKK